MNNLIDEQELRDVFQALRPDRDDFEKGVRNRLNTMIQQRSLPQPSHEQSPWLQVAASVVPLPLISKAAVAGATIPLAKVSLGYKLVGYAALPALSVLLVFGATLFALFRIRKAQISPDSNSADAVQQQSAILLKWWKTFGLIPLGTTFIAQFVAGAGYAVPVFVLFLSSGLAMVTLLTQLGRAGLVDRRTVAGSLIPSLVGLAQLSQIFTMVDSEIHLLDQWLVMMILFLAVFLLMLLKAFGIFTGWRLIAHTLWLVVAACLVFGFFGRSIWDPMTTQKIKSHVEAFDQAKFSSASWQRWAVPTNWLQQSGVPLDLSKPRVLLQFEIEREQNPFILGVASRIGLFVPAELSKVQDLLSRSQSLLDPNFRGQAIGAIEQQEFAVHALIMLDQWKESELELLESRLLETIRTSITPESGGLHEALIATKLLQALGRPCNQPTIQKRVQQKLVEMQRVGFHYGTRPGGFAAYPNLGHSDPLATSSAIELMEHYGVPSELNLMALRSFLRPSMDGNWIIDASAIRETTRMRLESLPEVPPLTWWDYVRHESQIAMAIMFAMLCLFATLGCPNQTINNAPSRATVC